MSIVKGIVAIIMIAAFVVSVITVAWFGVTRDPFEMRWRSMDRQRRKERGE